MCVPIEKDVETGQYADYFFMADVWDKDPRSKSQAMLVGQNRGLFRIYKETGEIELLAPMPEDAGNRRYLAASRKIRAAWEAGKLPDKSMFACG